MKPATPPKAKASSPELAGNKARPEFPKGQADIPDDFDEMGCDLIRALFEGDTPRR